VIAPRDRGTPIDRKRIDRWLATFSAYRTPVSAHLIELWLKQFKGDDCDLAARVLDVVHYVGNEHIYASFRDLLKSLEGWHQDPKRRKGRWLFVAFSGSAGESGDNMLHHFRVATGLDNRRYNDLFVLRSELTKNNPGPDDSVVLIDDFSGSGEQACGAWKDTFSELLASGPRVILMLVAATRDALKRIIDDTDMSPCCGVVLGKNDELFAKDCKHFTPTEKESLLSYCKVADESRPMGRGGKGLVIVFAHRTPNNSIPILHASHKNWQGLFPRAG